MNPVVQTSPACLIVYSHAGTLLRRRRRLENLVGLRCQPAAIPLQREGDGAPVILPVTERSRELKKDFALEGFYRDFWQGVAALFYTYFGYLVLVLLASKRRPRPVRWAAKPSLP